LRHGAATASPFSPQANAASSSRSGSLHGEIVVGHRAKAQLTLRRFLSDNLKSSPSVSTATWKDPSSSCSTPAHAKTHRGYSQGRRAHSSYRRRRSLRWNFRRCCCTGVTRHGNWRSAGRRAHRGRFALSKWTDLGRLVLRSRKTRSALEKMGVKDPSGNLRHDRSCAGKKKMIFACTGRHRRKSSPRRSLLRRRCSSAPSMILTLDDPPSTFS